MLLGDKHLKVAGSAVIWRAIQMGGTKLIYFLRLLVLARLLVPDDFGLLAIAMTAIGFFLSITNIGMIPALVQEQEVGDIQYNTAWTIGIVRALAITVVVALSAPLIANIFAEPRAVNVIRLLALRPLLEALGSIKVAELTRNLQFRSLTILRTIEAIVATLISVLLALSLGVWALVAGVLAGAASSMLVSYIIAPHRPRLSFDLLSSRRLIRFGQWIFVTGLIAMLGQYILRVVITRQLGTAGLGLYFLAVQLAFLPAEMSAEIIGSVAFPLFSRLQTDLEKARRAFRTMVIGMIAMLYPVCLLIVVLTPSFVAEILGPEWSGTESVIQVLAFATIIGVFGDGAASIIKGNGRPEKVTFIELIQTVILISLVSILTTRFGLVGAALAWLPAVTVSQIFSLIFVKQVLHQPLSGLGRPWLALLAASLTGASTAFLLDQFLHGLLGLIVSSLAALLLTLWVLWVSDRRFSLGFAQDLVSIFPKAAAIIRVPEPKALK